MNFGQPSDRGLASAAWCWRCSSLPWCSGETRSRRQRLDPLRRRSRPRRRPRPRRRTSTTASTTTPTTHRTVPTSTIPVTAPQTTSTSIGLPPPPTVPPITPPRTSTSLRRTTTTTRRVPIRKVADPPNKYGRAGIDTFNRWTSLLLAALVRDAERSRVPASRCPLAPAGEPHRVNTRLTVLTSQRASR